MVLSPRKRLWESTAVDSPSWRLCRDGRALSAGQVPSLHAALEHLSPPGNQGTRALLQIGLVSVTASKSVSWPRVERMVDCPSRSSWVQIVSKAPQKSRRWRCVPAQWGTVGTLLSLPHLNSLLCFWTKGTTFPPTASTSAGYVVLAVAG